MPAPVPTRTRPPVPRIMAVGICLVALAACGGDGDADEDAAPGASSTATTAVIDPGDGGRYAPAIDPADFGGPIDNPYLPLAPGARWVYEGISDGEAERTEVVVTGERRQVMGIDAVVVRDTVSVEGEVVEDTYDWFAQDSAGNVWYLGEDSREYEGGEVTSTEGSWEAGVDGALPGIVMPADPQVGDAYRQEFYAGEAEDLAEVLRLDASETVAGTTYDRLLVTQEWNPLEPDVVEEKSYAPGIGMVLEATTAGGEGRAELIEHTPGG
ncbi:MAG TPA: hypothetical protein VFI47_05445 [Acidimicrobiales bacterium]|nr:hypothetical protein [Acidimicrobiales bacterium]